MILTSREVLQLHVDLRDRLANPVGHVGQFITAYARSTYGQIIDTLAETVGRHVQHARTYHVEPQMMELVQRRADDLSRYDEVHRFGWSEPPFPVGFCVFDQPLETREMRNRIQRSVAVSWGPAQTVWQGQKASGRFLVFWAHAYRAPDDLTAEALSGNYSVPDEEPLPPAAFEAQVARQGGWMVSCMDFVSLDQRVGPLRVQVRPERKQQILIEGNTWPEEGTLNYARYMASLWDLMGETRTVVASEVREADLDRMTRKFARRNKINTDITTLTLRRENRPTLHPGTGTPLSWRVPVNGHNRTYHRGTSDEFTIFIKDHERGPKGAPLRVTKKVHRLAR
jgi:hypothetical protein